MSEGFPQETNHEQQASRCAHCGELTEEYELYTTKMGSVCWSCFEAYYNEKCVDCKANCSDSQLYVRQNAWGGEVYVCEECLLKSEKDLTS